MGREFGRSAGLVLALAMPGGIALAALYALGLLESRAALGALAATVGLAALLAIPFSLSVARARASLAGLGPDAAAPLDRELPRGLVARMIWPAALRLRRAWR